MSEEDLQCKDYIVVGYTQDQESKCIRDEDVIVRPLNHRWCVAGGEETRTWRLKSKPVQPTYGSCEHCCKSGPC
jgi:hypothetical protein